MIFSFLAVWLVAANLFHTQIAFTASLSKLAAQKVMMQIELKGDFARTVYSNRVACFLPGDLGKMVAQSAITGHGPEQKQTCADWRDDLEIVDTSPQAFKITDSTQESHSILLRARAQAG